MDEKVRVSEHAASMGGSQIFLEPGEQMTVRDLLQGGGDRIGRNDASVALRTPRRVRGGLCEADERAGKGFGNDGYPISKYHRPVGAGNTTRLPGISPSCPGSS